MSGQYISKEKFRDRRLYFISSRHFRLGVYRAQSGGFIGLRKIFSDTFLFEEYPSDGAVRVLKEMPETVPESIECLDTEGMYCQNCSQEVIFFYWPVGEEKEVTLSSGEKIRVFGEWRHVTPSECSKIRPVRHENQRLFDWLKSMEEKYSILLGL